VWNKAAWGCAASVLALMVAGCGSSGSSSTAVTVAKATTTPKTAASKPKVTPTFGEISLTSSVFANGTRMPASYTCQGADISPPLQWQGVPAKTAELFLIALELREGALSAKGAPILWAVAGIAPVDGGVAAGAIPAGSVVGTNSAGKIGYGGVCGTKGHHHIAFLIYALGKKVSLASGFNPTIARRRFRGTAIATGLILGSYHS
jgi:phosphatidylethanolamine-binding protein (PEBP) family uncharacterized protein